MATKMNVSLRYATHLAPLIAIMERTNGDVLELGTGIFSTPYLHYKCILSGRRLVSYENFKSWYDFLIKYGYQSTLHEIKFVEDYKDAKLDGIWDLALIDQTPDSSRIETVKRLANLASYIVIHDSNDDMNEIYHYSEIYPMFKYKKVWDKDSNHATILSNFYDLEDLW